MAHIRMSHGNESWHIYKLVMAYIWMSHGTHMNESCHTYERFITHRGRTSTPHSASTYATSKHTIQTQLLSALTLSDSRCSWREVFICASWLVCMCHMAHSHVWHTHSYVWHDSFICVTWLIHMCDMTNSYVWHDSFICVTWLIRMCDMTHSMWL